MATLQEVIADLADTVKAVDGMRAAPQIADDALNVTPFCILVPGEGSITHGVQGEHLCLDTILIDLHIAQRDTPHDIATLLPFIDSIPDAVFAAFVADQWGSTIETFEGITRSGMLLLPWQTVQHIGMRFTVTGIKRRINNM